MAASASSPFMKIQIQRDGTVGMILFTVWSLENVSGTVYWGIRHEFDAYIVGRDDAPGIV
ncbi:unnamed protein product, partial [Citrullus colocynthis]